MNYNYGCPSCLCFFSRWITLKINVVPLQSILRREKENVKDRYKQYKDVESDNPKY